jgi:alpha-glucosidase (family GH31 glycosyl hydrolase)
VKIIANTFYKYNYQPEEGLMFRTRWLDVALPQGFLFIAMLFTAGFGAAVGNYQSHGYVANSSNQIDSNHIEFKTGTTQKVRIYVCTPSIVRVSLDDRGTFTSTKDVLGMDDVNRTWPLVTGLTVTDATPGTSGSVVIATSALKITVAKSPFRISYAKADGTALTADAAAMQSAGTSQSVPTFTFTQGVNEHYFGWGLAFEQFRTGYHKIDHKNQTYSTRRGTACYMYSTGGYGMFFLFAEPVPPASQWGSISNPTTGTGFDLRGATAKYWMNATNDYDFGGAMEYASFYFIAGNWKEAMTGYTDVSGKPPRLGKKYYGIMRDLYYPAGTSIATFTGWIDMFRSNRFNMDWVRMDNFFDWTNLGYATPPGNCWNTAAPEVIKKYHDAGFNFGGMSAGWGFYGCCAAGCTQNLVQDVAHATTAVNNGFDFAWYDAMNYQKRSSAKEQWDVWTAAHGGDETKVMISRGWQSLSSQSWPAAHMGDYLNDPYIYAVFTSALQEHLVGYAYSHCDLGEGYDFGYMGYTLRPMVTIHMAGAAGGTATDFQECGKIGAYPADLKDVIRKWGNWHYRFIPYLFTYGMIAHETGIPVTRGMMCQNNGEQTAATYGLMYQAYVGEELIWSPYYFDNPDDKETGARHNIYLPSVPSGAWYDYFEGTKYRADTTIGTYVCDPGTGRANLKLPVFVKAGAIIPLMDTLQFIGEKPETLITVQAWPTNGTSPSLNGSFTLYEDEGASATATPSKTTFTTSYTFSDTTHQTTLTIGAFAGSKYCATATARKYRVELHNLPSAVTSVLSNGASLASITRAQYDAGASGFFWDAAKGGVCFINATGPANTGFAVVASNEAAGVRGPLYAGALEHNVIITRRSRSIEVTVPFKVRHAVQVITLQGKLVFSQAWNSAGTHEISLQSKTPMVYLGKVSAGSQTVVKKLIY